MQQNNRELQQQMSVPKKSLPPSRQAHKPPPLEIQIQQPKTVRFHENLSGLTIVRLFAFNLQHGHFQKSMTDPESAAKYLPYE